MRSKYRNEFALRISDQYLTIGGRNQTLAYTCKPSRNQGSKVRNREQNQC